MEGMAALALLRVSGYLAGAERQITGPRNFEISLKRDERIPDARENVMVRGQYLRKFRRAPVIEDESEEQAAPAQEDGAAAAGAAQDWDAIRQAGGFINILVEPARGPQDDGRRRPFP